MRWLIRRVLSRGRGSISYEEDTHYGNVLSIGRASDQAIFLPDLSVALEHAKITALSDNQYRVESLILAGIRVNTESTYAATVGVGAIIEVGKARIQILEKPSDHDAAVEISTIEKDDAEIIARTRGRATALSQTWLSKRRPAYIFTFAVLIFAVMLPLLAHYMPGLRNFLHKSPLPAQGSLQTGQLASPHQAFGAQCILCHETPLIPVQDKACLRCHSQIAAHADPVQFELPELGEARCAHCHRDHNGKHSLIRQDQRLCADCHSDLHNNSSQKSQLADVSDFGIDHPEFMIDLPVQSTEKQIAIKRVRRDTPDIEEKSGLKFPHDVHLNAKGLNTPKGQKILTCADCHQAEPGGAKMLPVKFETMCHDCHTLGFSVRSAEREVPHAKVTEVAFTIEEFFAKQALMGSFNDTTAPNVVRTRRRPGQAISVQERQEALTWARDQAKVATESLFTGKACAGCHSVYLQDDGLWNVRPVRVAGEWYSKANFTHAKHSTRACADCHNAAQSNSSSDLLIPGIENCQQCHAGEHGKDKVANTCVDCHGFHTSNIPMRSNQ